VLAENNFSSKQQIDLLDVLNYALHKKHYSQDICGVIEKKLKLLQKTEQEAANAVSNLHLSTQKGLKVKFIRVMNCLCELKFFTDKQGDCMTKTEVFETIGNAVNQDLSDFQNNINASYQAANADMENTLVIFQQMFDKQIEINAKKTGKKTRK
jgi:hypothetical protein